MTFSILAFDQKTSSYGGAAATGSLCVGGWVLKGDAQAGLSASQGTAPSTLWGTDVLERMRAGAGADEAIAEVTEPDTGRDHRQLAALAPDGAVAAFTGNQSIPFAGSEQRSGIIAAGNMLSGADVLPAVLSAFEATSGALAVRLLAALNAGDAAGGDSRGLLSAALLVVSRDTAPLTLRIDHSDDPLASLAALYRRSQTDPYRFWATQVPTLNDPHQRGSGAEDGPAGELRKAVGGLGSNL